MISATLLFLACLAPCGDQDPDTAKKQLLQALMKEDQKLASPAVAVLKKTPGRDSVRALVATHRKAVAIETMQAASDETSTYKKLKIKSRESSLAMICRSIEKALKGMTDPESAAEQVKLLRQETSPHLAAALAAAILKSEGGVAALLKCTRSGNALPSRIAAMDAFRKSGTEDEALFDQALKLLKDGQLDMRSATAKYLGETGKLGAIKPLVDLVARSDATDGHYANMALISLTGVNMEGDGTKWRAWYKSNEAAIDNGTFKNPNPAGTGATFYGVRITGSKVVFVLDRSASMRSPSEWRPEAPSKEDEEEDEKKKQYRRIDVARIELKNAIQQLPSEATFNIIFYGKEVTVFRETMAPCTPEEKKAAYELIDEVGPLGGTPMSLGLEAAFKLALPEGARKPEVDMIFLLSDGMPNGGIDDPLELMQFIRKQNKQLRIPVYPIAIEPSTDSIKLMSQIARENGGKLSER